MLVFNGRGVVGGVFPLNALEVAGSLSHVVGEVLSSRVELIARSEVAVVVPIEVKSDIGLDTQPFEGLGLEEDVPQDLI